MCSKKVVCLDRVHGSPVLPAFQPAPVLGGQDSLLFSEAQRGEMEAGEPLPSPCLPFLSFPSYRGFSEYISEPSLSLFHLLLPPLMHLPPEKA